MLDELEDMLNDEDMPNDEDTSEIDEDTSESGESTSESDLEDIDKIRLLYNQRKIIII